MEIIKIKDLTFTYPEAERAALTQINLSVRAGEFVTICGKSGCGKTTLLRFLKPILSPKGKMDGEVLFQGCNIQETDSRKQAEEIGFVTQNPDNQIVTDKVWHELAFGLESLGYSTTEIRTRVSEMALYFGIEDWFHKKVNDLSGGQKQLLNLASVMVMQPSVLVLDEPTSQLDPIAAQEFLRTLEKINHELGTTIIMCEHRLEETFPISNRIIVMDEGEIIADESPREIGRILQNHDMYLALPAPIRIYGSVNNDLPCPVTVREGRNWLMDFSQKHVLRPELISSENQLSSYDDKLIEIKDVWFRYEKNLPDILKGLSMKISKGNIYAIMGGNGAGKTTLISLISGLNKPYRGRVLIDGTEVDKIPNLYSEILGVLPQNPQTLFTQKTVYLELMDMLADKNISLDKKEEIVRDISTLCRLEKVLRNHPYDLSGGEQQRTALAKILIKNPEIIILDEPTKGMDAHFKKIFANILKTLKDRGKTIIIVSHDIDFCAEYADRCAMLFDGGVAGEDIPKRFFSDKSFYTTSANRMSREIIPDAIIAEDVIVACGGEMKRKEVIDTISDMIHTEKEKKPEKIEKHLSYKRIVAGIVFGLIFVTTFLWGKERFTDWRALVYQFITIIEAATAILFFIPKKEIRIKNIKSGTKDEKLNKKTLITALIALIAVPLTILFGMYCLDDRRYYFISMLIILETLIPFFVIFEGRKPESREIVLLSVICAIAIAGRSAFYMIPQFKPVLAIIIIAGVCFGAESGFMVGVITAFVSNFFFGQGPWTPWQMFAFGMVGFIAGIIFGREKVVKNNLLLCIFGGIVTLIIYGGIMNPASVIMYQENPTVEMIISSYIMGVPFDLIHAASTMFFLWFIAEPMINKIERAKIKYGLIRK